MEETKKEMIETIGSKSSDNGELPEGKSVEANTESEAQKKMRELAEKAIKLQFKLQFLQVAERLDKGMTLDEIIEEVNQKKSTMTRSAREFVTNFKEETIMKWYNDRNK